METVKRSKPMCWENLRRRTKWWGTLWPGSGHPQDTWWEQKTTSSPKIRAQSFIWLIIFNHYFTAVINKCLCVQKLIMPNCRHSWMQVRNSCSETRQICYSCTMIETPNRHTKHWAAKQQNKNRGTECEHTQHFRGILDFSTLFCLGSSQHEYFSIF